MRKILSTLLFIFVFQNIQAQVVFCPTGAEWHYSFYVFLPNTHYNAKIKYIKDTMIGQETFKVLSNNAYYKYCNVGDEGLTFIKQKGDTIFMRSAATQNSWQILYNYAALPGQSWITTVSSSYNFSFTTTYTVTVDSIKYITVNSFLLKNFFARYKNSKNSLVENLQITERFGCNWYMFNYDNPLPFSDCDRASYFLCYQDDAFGLQQFTEKPCDYRDYVGIYANNYRRANIMVYPNPANGFFNIRIKNTLITAENKATITDFCGREIKQFTINVGDPETGKIDISELANGVYILSISNNKELIYTGKLIKTE